MTATDQEPCAEVLAGAASISGRTVQRAEEGRLISAESLQAIAAALDVTLDALRSNPLADVARMLGVSPGEVTEEMVDKKIAEFKERHRTFPLTVVKTSADVGPAFDGDALHFNCLVATDEVRDVAAALQEYVGDVMNLRGDLEPTSVRDHERRVFEIVTRLNALGCAVSVGIDRHALRLDNGATIPSWTTSYVIVAPAAAPRTVAMMDKRARIDLSP